MQGSLATAQSLVISPDGRSIYVGASGATSAVSVFGRNPTTGSVTFLQKVTDADAPAWIQYPGPGTGGPTPPGNGGGGAGGGNQGMTINRGALYTNNPRRHAVGRCSQLGRLASSRERRRLSRRQDVRGQEHDPLAARGVGSRAPAEDGLPALRQRRSDVHRRHHPRPDQADGQLSDCRGPVARQQARLVTATASKRPDLPRAHPCQGCDVGGREGAVRAQQASPERASQVQADQPIQGSPAHRSTCACGIALATTAAGGRFDQPDRNDAVHSRPRGVAVTVGDARCGRRRGGPGCGQRLTADAVRPRQASCGWILPNICQPPRRHSAA